jgi:hypothetical protein
MLHFLSDCFVGGALSPFGGDLTATSRDERRRAVLLTRHWPACPAEDMRMTDRSNTPMPKARADRLLVRQVGDEWLYYDLDSHKVICLNTVSASVLRLCDGTRTAPSIARGLQSDDIDEHVVQMTLQKLSKVKLLEGPYNAPANSARANRRDMIRKFGAGAGALAVMPVVSAITVPTPVQAASCVGFHGFCTSNAQCCSGNCHTNSNKCM